MADWYADRDKIINEVLPRVDREITAINDWSRVIAGMQGANETTTELSRAKAECDTICEMGKVFQANIARQAANLPGLLARVQGLLGK
jgi:hypothetical protein